MDYGYGNRHNSNQPKQAGFYGEIPVGNDVMTELSVGVNLNGKETEIPSIVPGLTREEINAIATNPSNIPESVMQKAIASALRRQESGMSPYWGVPEKRYPMPE